MANRVQVTALLLLALFAVGVMADGASRSSSYLGAAGSGKSFKAAKTALLDAFAKQKGTTYKITSEKVGDNSYSVTYEFPSAAVLADFQTWQYKQPDYAAKLEKFYQKPKSTGAGRRMLAIAAEGASRSSSYLGAAGSGKSFKAAKTALLDAYAKQKGTTYKLTSEKVGDNSYSVTYEFPSAAVLADFQAWQYKQPDYAAKLEKFSQKPKGTTGRRML